MNNNNSVNGTAPSPPEEQQQLGTLDLISVALETSLIIFLLATWGWCKIWKRQRRLLLPRTSDAEAILHEGETLQEGETDSIDLGDVSSFYLLGYSRHSPGVLLLFRLLAFGIYFIPAFLVYAYKNYWSKGRSFMMYIRYFSSINFIFFGVYYFISTAATAIYFINRPRRRDNPPPSKRRYEAPPMERRLYADLLTPLSNAVGLLFILKLVTSVISTAIAWMAYAGRSSGSNDVGRMTLAGFLTHGGNTIVLAVEFFCTDIQIHPTQSLLVGILPLLYFCYIVYFMAIGYFPEYAYPYFLDPYGTSGWWAVFIRLANVPGWMAVFFAIYVVWLLKQWALKEIRRWRSRREENIY